MPSLDFYSEMDETQTPAPVLPILTLNASNLHFSLQVISLRYRQKYKESGVLGGAAMQRHVRPASLPKNTE